MARTTKQNVATVEQKKEGTTMENKTFNVWEHTYKTIVKAFIENGEQDTFSFRANHYFDSNFTSKDGKEIHIDGVKKVLTFLNNKTGLKVVKVEHVPSEDGTKEVYKITIKDFNIKAEVDGKYGKYKLFAKQYGRLKLA